MNGYVYIARISAFIVILLEISAIYANHYTDKWAVHITGGERVARDVADKYGFVYLDQIMPDYYHLQHRKVAKRSIYSSSYHHRDLVKDKNVKWLEQQVVKRRVKRDIHFNDPKWPKMWYLNRGHGVDMNVRQAWSQGYTGKGVVVTILDDGIEKDHPDLSRNYDEEASYDVNSHDPDPQPRYDSSNENRHGTRCAGEVAAQADNHFCSVGVAFDARIGGVRMLDGDVTDSVEAQSLSLNPQHIHVYSASWGPDDDGRTVDGPATLARKAFHDGITRGRGGLGSIFVWASGNGGRDRDSCNCDGYTNSIYTLSISSATENGNIPWYSEACSSTLATTYSSGGGGEKQIVTTDLRKGCTDTHTGTSASAPLAAGLCALALQSNPLLTWRDMQHLVVLTAKPSNLQAADWVTNGVGRKVSHSFGYGLMDAAAMVQVARNWTTVPKQHICEIKSHGHKKVIPMHGKITVPLYTNGCEGQGNVVRFLEHVEAKVTLTSSRRGEILIYLTSPMGTRSTLLDRRLRDTSREGFNTWAFMTTHSWGEIAKGTWILEIENGASIFQPAVLKDWSLVLYGTEVTPEQPPSTTVATSTPVTTTSTAFIPTPSITTPRGARRSSSTTSAPTTTLQKNQASPVFHPYIWRTYYSYHQWRSSAYARRKFFRPNYKQCIYQTLSIDDQSSLSLIKHMTSRRSAELKEWTLVVMGTATHPQTHQYSSTLVLPGGPPNTHKLPECAGVSTKGICIECVVGYFMLNNGCVKVCPSGYFGKVVLSSPEGSPTTEPPDTSRWTDGDMRPYGVCDPCHAACLTCQGPGNDCCFSCSPKYHLSKEKCVAKFEINLELALILTGLGVGVVLLLVVGFLFMKFQGKAQCCCLEKRHIVDLSKGKYNGISLSSVDFESDSEADRSEVECAT